jgi:YHS domain-containing protein
MNHLSKLQDLFPCGLVGPIVLLVLGTVVFNAVTSRPFIVPTTNPLSLRRLLPNDARVCSPQSSRYTSRTHNDDEFASNKSARHSISLDLAVERQVAMRHEPPVSTLTWFYLPENEKQKEQQDLDLTEVARIFECRAQKIIQANPWLNGKETGSGNLVYDEVVIADNKSSNTVSAIVNVISKGDFNYVDITTHPAELYENIVEYTQLQSHKNVWKVTLLPGKEVKVGNNKYKRHASFALVLTMSHNVADAHTFYQIYDMLTKASPNDANIRTLDMRTPAESDTLAKDMLGSAAWDFVHGPMINVKGALGMMDKMIWNRQGKSLWLEVDTEAMANAKETSLVRCKEDTIAGSSNLTSRNNFVSTNDVLSSWFFSSADCGIGLVCTNYRGKLPGHSSELGRNYWGARLYTPEQFQTAAGIRQGMQSAAASETNYESRPTLTTQLKILQQPLSITSSWTRTTKRSNTDNDTLLFPVDLHLPLYDFATYCPSNFCVLRSWNISPSRIGIYVAGDARLVDRIEHKMPAFLAPLDVTPLNLREPVCPMILTRENALWKAQRMNRIEHKMPAFLAPLDVTPLNLREPVCPMILTRENALWKAQRMNKTKISKLCDRELEQPKNQHCSRNRLHFCEWPG